MKFILTLLLATLTPLFSAEKRNVLLLAGTPSHAPGHHEHNAGVQLLAKCLGQGAADLVDVKLRLNGQWPTPEELAWAHTILIYCDGGKSHMALQADRLAQLGKEMKRGCGLICLHYAVEPAYEKDGWAADSTTPPPPERGSKGKGAAEFLEWLGGYFEQHWSVNPHWVADFKQLPKHPISAGVQPFSTNDEWYYHMRFRRGMKAVTPILSDLPPTATTSRPDGPHSGNPEQRKAVLESKEPQHVAWAIEREDGGRGFGFTGGHYHAAWGNNDQRKLVLNAILWTAKAEVPAQGVQSTVTPEDLAANLDPKNPKK